MDAPLLIAIMGPTASGKTAVAEALAAEHKLQLINADAFQVYRGLDIGTAKSPHRDDYEMLDLVDPADEYGVGRWILQVASLLQDLHRDGRGAVVVGGSGHYIRALFERFTDMATSPDPDLRAAIQSRELADVFAELKARNPAAAARVDALNPIRVRRALERLDSPRLEWSIPEFRQVKIGLLLPHEILKDRINRRVLQMIDEGWVEEVKHLREIGVKRSDPGMRAHGYRALFDVVENVLSLADAVEQTATEVRQYAKRQRTWLRAEPNLATIEAVDEGTALAEARKLVWGV